MEEELIALDTICTKYFGVTPKIARRKAAMGTLPITAFRLTGHRRGPLFVRKEDLDRLIRERQAAARSRKPIDV